MAREVHTAFIEIIAQQRGIPTEKADEFDEDLDALEVLAAADSTT